MAVKTIWNPALKGLSVSALNLFWINPVAFELKYFQGFIPVEAWNKNTGYGSLIGAGIEGFIKHRTDEAITEFIDKQYKKDIAKFNEWDDIAWWTELAIAQARVFCSRYSKDFDKFKVTRAEAKLKETITLPSGRTVVLNGYLDGEGKDIIFEHKCRAEWNPERIASEIDMDLQYNFYLLLYYSNKGQLPGKVWYQHSRRPGGFGYRGPKKKETETKDTYLKRLIAYVQENEEDHFYQFMSIPNMDRFQRFLHTSLYPKLEQFLDWYDYLTGKESYKVRPVSKGTKKDWNKTCLTCGKATSWTVDTMPDAEHQCVCRHGDYGGGMVEKSYNSLHVMTPYGLYNPYLEGTDEVFRHYALTGSTLGLRRKASK